MGRIGSTKLVLPKWLSYGMLNRVLRVLTKYQHTDNHMYLLYWFSNIDTDSVFSISYFLGNLFQWDPFQLCITTSWNCFKSYRNNKFLQQDLNPCSNIPWFWVLFTKDQNYWAICENYSKINGFMLFFQEYVPKMMNAKTKIFQPLVQSPILKSFSLTWKIQ